MEKTNELLLKDQLEALLSTYFSQDPVVPMTQLLWGYIHFPERPDQTIVYANDDGIIELPNYGYLKTPKRGYYLTLVADKKTQHIYLLDDKIGVGFSFEPLLPQAHESLTALRAGNDSSPLPALRCGMAWR